MSRVEAAAADDRLPWLPDEPPPARRRDSAVRAGAAAAVVAVAGVGLWIGGRSLGQPERASSSASTTVRLPEPRTQERSSSPTKAEVVATSPRAELPRRRDAGPAPVRLVQVGAFGSPQQARAGWRAMVRRHASLARFSAGVVAARNSKGRRFYRVQLAAGSQEDALRFCDRMHGIDFSCAVVGFRMAPVVH